MKQRYLLDSGIAELWLQPGSRVRSPASRVRIAGGIVGTGTPVFGELLAGIEASQSRQKNMLRFYRSISDLVLWSYDRTAAEEFGRLLALLRKIGRPMQQIDVQTAAIAFSLSGTTVVTSDSDFSAIPGLTIEDWSK